VNKISVDELAKLTAIEYPHISARDKDEMAIPSYLHKNPLIRWLMWKRYALIARLSEFRSDMAVLEFGCGTGVFLPELSRRCAKVYAMDLFPEYAQHLSRQLSLKIAFVPSLAEIPSGSLDLIVAADVLEHLTDKDRLEVLSTFSAKLKDSGRFIVSGPTENRMYRAGRIVAGFGGKGDYHKTHIDALMVIIIRAGFIQLRQKTLPFVFPPYLFKVCEFKKYQAA
jgi:2-polyprenyl-3-methyl-5-hydroxy-6-metoxy-1,4-benzoquinol methylase